MSNRSVYDDIIMNIDNYAYIKSVLTLMDPNHRIFEKNMTLMHICIFTNDINIVEMVLKSGGDPNIKDEDGVNPTDMCIVLTKPAKFLKLLMSYKGKLSFA